ncbi:MAG: hypothetical protein AAFN18_23715, partial [Cyanobacteria bacterium J06554_6]
WLRQQPPELCAELLDMELSDAQQQSLETIVEVVEQLQRLNWGPGRIGEELRSQFSIPSLAHLTPDQRQQWLSYLRSQLDTKEDDNLLQLTQE